MGEEAETTEFDWDGGNAEKNWLRHRVTQAECEQVFFNRPFVVAEDIQHSESEDRFFGGGLERGQWRVLTALSGPSRRGAGFRAPRGAPVPILSDSH